PSLGRGHPRRVVLLAVHRGPARVGGVILGPHHVPRAVTLPDRLGPLDRGTVHRRSVATGAVHRRLVIPGTAHRPAGRAVHTRVRKRFLARAVIRRAIQGLAVHAGPGILRPVHCRSIASCASGIEIAPFWTHAPSVRGESVRRHAGPVAAASHGAELLAFTRAVRWTVPSYDAVLARAVVAVRRVSVNRVPDAARGAVSVSLAGPEALTGVRPAVERRTVRAG